MVRLPASAPLLALAVLGCAEGHGTGARLTPCDGPADCPVGQACEDGLCADRRCSDEFDCDAGQVCVQGRCTRPGSLPGEGEGGEEGEGEGEGEGQGEGEGEGEGQGEGEGEGEGEGPAEGEGEGPAEGEGEGPAEGEGEGPAEGEGEGGPLACLRDADCNEGRVCILSVDPDTPAGIRQECGRPSGAGAGGGPCDSGSDCLTGRCLDTGCFSACLNEADCGPVQDCTEVVVVVDDRGTPDRMDDVTTTARSCVHDPGSGLACGRDADCPAVDEVCVPSFEPGADDPGLACARTAGGGGPGADCAGGEECAAGICLNRRFCFGACDGPGDCPPAAPLCAETRLVPDEGEPSPPMRICQPEPTACTRDADCLEAEACVFTRNPAAPDEILLVCQGAAGRGGPGAACVRDRDCRSGVCLEDLGRCWGACEGDADCQDGSHCYYPFRWVDIADEGQPPVWDAIPGCDDDRGSWQECSANAQCPGGEWCRPIANRWRRAWQGRCTVVEGGGGQPGLPCRGEGECASEICLGAYPNSACFGLCRDDGDCAGGRRCRRDDWVVDDANTPDDLADDASAPLDFCFL